MVSWGGMCLELYYPATGYKGAVGETDEFRFLSQPPLLAEPGKAC